MIATFRFEELDQAMQIMRDHNSILRYSRINAEGKDICIVENGPMAAIVEIRYKLSRPEDLKLLNLM